MLELTSEPDVLKLSSTIGSSINDVWDSDVYVANVSSMTWVRQGDPGYAKPDWSDVRYWVKQVWPLSACGNHPKGSMTKQGARNQGVKRRHNVSHMISNQSRPTNI
jgi:hypothetical protein